MKKIIYPVIFGVLLCAVSCRKYVEVPTVQSRVLRYTSDYQQLMQNTNKFDIAYYSPVFATDDLGTTALTWQTPLTEPQANAYSWLSPVYGSDVEDLDWSTLYGQIKICNTVLDDVDQSENGTPTEKNRAKSYALVQRAYSYYTLINMYAKQYEPSTAASDPGVPLLTTSRFFVDLTRASVDKVYEQMIADLNQALPMLPDLPDFNSNPSKSAAYAMLARVYLNMRNFNDADKCAALTLELKHNLLDLNTYVSNPKSIPDHLLNPEEIFFKKTNGFPVNYPLSEDAMKNLDPNDLRYVLFTADGATMVGSNFTTRAYWRFKILNDGNYVGPNVPEMMLIRAECAARADLPDDATSILNALRIKRFKPADYKPLFAANGNAALHLVTDERKREFLGRGFRWFDQRRLAKDPGFITTVVRVYKGVNYTLDPNSNRYVYPIADKYLLLNPEITQNPK